MPARWTVRSQVARVERARHPTRSPAHGGQIVELWQGCQRSRRPMFAGEPVGVRAGQVCDQHRAQVRRTEAARGETHQHVDIVRVVGEQLRDRGRWADSDIRRAWRSTLTQMLAAR